MLLRSLAAASIAFLLAAQTFAAGHDVTGTKAGPTSYAVTEPRVATNGDTFLTLWTTTVGTAGPFIHASVADASGRAIAPSFRLLPFSAELVDLTAFGSRYLAVWQNLGILHSSVISSSGVVIEAGPAVPTPPNPSSYANRFTSVHSNGRTVLFTYQTNGPLLGTIETRAQLTAADGTPIGKPIVLGILGDQTIPAAVPVGNDYIVITTEGSGTYVIRLDGNGNVVLPKRRIGASSSVYRVDAASNGTEILVATPAYFVTLTGDGTVVNTRSIEPKAGEGSSIVWTGDAYLHIRRRWFESTAVSQRVDRLGTPLDGPLPLNAGIDSVSAHDGVVYAAGRTEDGTIVGVAMTGANAPLNGSGDILSVTPVVQTAPVLASDGVDFLTGWTEEIARSHAFAVRRVSRTATPLDEQQTDLGPVDSPNDQYVDAAGPHIAHHGVACSGGTCLAVWQDSFTIRGKWMTGAAASSSSFVIGRGVISDQPVVWNGREFFVVWVAPGLSWATISTAGVVSAPTTLLTEGGNSPPEVGWDGKHYLLMFLNDVSQCDCPGSRSAIYFLTMSAGGTILGESGFFASFFDAHLASSGHDFLMTYDYSEYPTPGVQLATRRIVATDADPQIDAPIPLFQWGGRMSSSVTWNGTDYVAAWRYGAGSIWWLSEARVTTSAFPARRVTASGIPDRQVAPAIATNAAGESVIAVSEALTPGDPARLRVYAESELAALPALPSTPFAVYVTGSATRATVSWQSDGRDVTGFIVEHVYGDYGESVAVAAADARSIVINNGSLDLRVRAFNASGQSEYATAVINPPRRRAAGR